MGATGPVREYSQPLLSLVRPRRQEDSILMELRRPKSARRPEFPMKHILPSSSRHLDHCTHGVDRKGITEITSSSGVEGSRRNCANVIYGYFHSLDRESIA